MADKINGGAVLWARKTIESEIFTDKPNMWFKIWFYLVAKANHKNNGKFNRGQCFLKYEWIEEATHATHNQVKHCIEYLKKATMLATQKKTRGMLITIINYDFYQTLDNYYYSKSHTERNIKGTQKEHRSHTINKNDKNDKNDKKKSIAVAEATAPLRDFHLEAKELFDYYTAQYAKKITAREKPIFNWGRCEKAVKPFLKQLGLERLKKLIDLYFNTDDKFYKNSAWGLELFLASTTLHALNAKCK